MATPFNRIATSLSVLALALTASCSKPANQSAQQAVPKVTIGIGGKTLFSYLPVTLAQQLGYFKQAGVDVTIDDFQGGSKSLEALVGGSVDFVAGGYENTLILQQKHQALKAIELLTDRYGLVLGVYKTKAASYHGPASMKGWKVGVTAPGSAVANALDIILSKGGLKPSDVSTVGIGGGAGAVAAMRSGELDALMLSDPAITQLSQDGTIKVEVDSRTAQGQQYIYGGPNAASSVYTTAAYAKSDPKAVQAVTTALVRAQKWLTSHDAAAVMQVLPKSYYASDPATYKAALTANLPTFSTDGHITPQLAQQTYTVMKSSGRIPPSANLDVAATLDDSFWQAASKQ